MRRRIRLGVGVCAALLVMAYAGVASGQATFGTARESYYTMGAWEFLPVDSTQTYSDVGLSAGLRAGAINVRRYSTGGDSGFIAGPHLPDGALLTSIRYDLCDTNQADLHWSASFWRCTGEGVCVIIGDEVISFPSEILPCNLYDRDLSLLNIVVDNQTWRLFVAANPDADDDTNALAGVRIGYKLQVSPAPAFPSFADVPTDHPFFQYIEALAASGITAGCGIPNFCPDNPVTRGQMAVFLAKALGLQWPLP